MWPDIISSIFFLVFLLWIICRVVKICFKLEYEQVKLEIKMNLNAHNNVDSNEAKVGDLDSKHA